MMDNANNSRSESVLSLQGISKRYGTVQALQNVSLECFAGEIHAVVGENGSGKSTLLGVASGYVEPDEGTVHIVGQPLRTDSPAKALDLGLGMAYQEISQVASMTVAENLYMATTPSKRPSYWKLKDWAIQILAQFELDDLFAEAPVGYLALAERQLLEVVKALLTEPKVLLLDEPTTAMGPAEVEWLHRTIREYADEGIGVVYVSHRLSEVLDVVDRITVLRDGDSQGTYEATGMTESELVELMIGRPLESAFPEPIQQSADAEAVLEVEDLHGEFFGPLSFQVGPGEIVGIAGVEGNGQGDFFLTLSGTIPPKGGLVKVNGTHVNLTSPNGALKGGIMLLAGNRKRDGLFPVLGVRSNATIQVLGKFSSAGWLRPRAERSAVAKMIEFLKLRTPSMEQPVSFLSGGNQQKVVMTRPFLRDSVRVIMADEPTQGVDVRSRFDIYEALHTKAEEGAAIIVKSSDPIELSGFCNRVFVISRGQFVHEIPQEELSERRIIEAMVRGAKVGSVAEQFADAGIEE